MPVFKVCGAELGISAETGAMYDVEAVFPRVSGKSDRQWTAGSAGGPAARSRRYVREVDSHCGALGNGNANVGFRCP
jgi:hypothetical protein